MKCYIKPTAQTVIWCITQQVRVTVRQHWRYHLHEAVYADSRWDWEVIVVKKDRLYSFRWVVINKQISYNVGNCLLPQSIQCIARITTLIGWGWLANILLFWKLNKEARSKDHIQDKRYPYMLMEMINWFELTDSCLLGIRTHNTS
jgi:hypothetical protein